MLAFCRKKARNISWMGQKCFFGWDFVWFFGHAVFFSWIGFVASVILYSMPLPLCFFMKQKQVCFLSIQTFSSEKIHIFLQVPLKAFLNPVLFNDFLGHNNSSVCLFRSGILTKCKSCSSWHSEVYGNLWLDPWEVECLLALRLFGQINNTVCHLPNVHTQGVTFWSFEMTLGQEKFQTSDGCVYSLTLPHHADYSIVLHLQENVVLKLFWLHFQAEKSRTTGKGGGRLYCTETKHRLKGTVVHPTHWSKPPQDCSRLWWENLNNRTNNREAGPRLPEDSCAVHQSMPRE